MEDSKFDASATNQKGICTFGTYFQSSFNDTKRQTFVNLPAFLINFSCMAEFQILFVIKNLNKVELVPNVNHINNILTLFKSAIFCLKYCDILVIQIVLVVVIYFLMLKRILFMTVLLVVTLDWSVNKAFILCPFNRLRK